MYNIYIYNMECGKANNQPTILSTVYTTHLLLHWICYVRQGFVGAWLPGRAGGAPMAGVCVYIYIYE